jgi:hypothetical protein
MGTNALPTLLRMLQQPNSKFLFYLITKLHYLHLLNRPYTPACQDFRAFYAFEALGPDASNAVPQLVAIFNRKPSPFSQMIIPVILGDIGPGPIQSVPLLLRAIHHTNEAVRFNAIYGLARIHPEPAVAVPALTEMLKDTCVFVRASAASTLRSYGSSARSAFPAILEAWRKEPPPPAGRISVTYNYAVGAYWSILTNSLHEDAPRAMREALRGLDPEAAAQAGVP